MSNAGTSSGDTGSIVEWVDAVDRAGNILRLEKRDMSFAYRKSNLVGQRAAFVGLKLRPDGKNVIMDRIKAHLARRAKTQPLGTRNVGSIFKNPPGDHAARLIEVSDLKGRRVGGAEVSRLHANFIVNADRATARDVLSLIDLVRRTVQERHGVSLELEVVPVGDDV